VGKIGTNTLLEHALDGDYHSGELGNGQHGERNVADAHAHAKLSSVTANQHHLQLHKASHYPATGGDAAPFNRTATYVIAASNASALSKFGADKVCTGTADDVDINWAIEALTAAGGLVALTEGAFVLNNSILHKSLVTLEGDGPNTVIQYTDAIAGDAAIGHHDGTTYRQVIRATIRDLKIENTGTNSAKSGVAIGWDDNIPHRVVIENVEADGCNLYICCGAKHRIECCYVHSIRTGGTPQDCAIGIRGIGTTSVYDSIIAYNDVCLLYTSPSPRDRTRSRMPSSA